MHCKQEKMGRARDKRVDMRAHDKQVEVVDCYIFYIYIYIYIYMYTWPFYIKNLNSNIPDYQA